MGDHVGIPGVVLFFWNYLTKTEFASNCCWLFHLEFKSFIVTREKLLYVDCCLSGKMYIMEKIRLFPLVIFASYFTRNLIVFIVAGEKLCLFPLLIFAGNCCWLIYPKFNSDYCCKREIIIC